MNGAVFIKTISGVIGLAVASLFPTEFLMTLMWCGFLLGTVDTAVGMNAAVYRGEKLTIVAFISKIGKKILRATAYLALAWVATQILGQALHMAVPLAEPVGFVLAALVATEMLSILKNLSAAHNNIPIIDRYFKKFVNAWRDATEPEKISGDTPAKDN